MLVLSRQRDEVIKIGDEIEITIVDIRGDKVRLGINAPAKVAVHRKEVYDAIIKENAEAAASAVEGLAGVDRPAGVSGAGAGGGGAMKLVRQTTPGTKVSARLAVKAPSGAGVGGGEIGTRVAVSSWAAKSA